MPEHRPSRRRRTPRRARHGHCGHWPEAHRCRATLAASRRGPRGVASAGAEASAGRCEPRGRPRRERRSRAVRPASDSAPRGAPDPASAMSGVRRRPNQQVVPRPRSSAGRAGRFRFEREWWQCRTQRPARRAGSPRPTGRASSKGPSTSAGWPPTSSPPTAPEAGRMRASRRSSSSSRPTNVTGSLHLGHAQRTAVEDVMIAPRPDAGASDALPAGPRPRQHRRPVRPRPDHRRRRRDPGEPGPGALPRADVALHRRDAGRDPGPAAAPGRLPRLGSPPVHDGRRLQPRRARGLPPPLPRGPRLPPRDAHQLVSRLPDQPLRPRGDRHARDGHALDDPLPPGRRGHRAPTSRAR